MESKISKLFHSSSSDPKRLSTSGEGVGSRHSYSNDGSYQQPQQQQQHYPPAQGQQQQHSNGRTHFASLSLHGTDRLRLLEFPNEVVDAVRGVIARCYPAGVQSEKNNYGGAHEFKLKGYPWTGQGKDAITSRLVIRETLAVLYTHNWILIQGVDVSRKEIECDTLLFRHDPHPSPTNPRPQTLDWLAISFNEYDKLRLIGAPEILHQAVGRMLHEQDMLSREEWKDRERGAWEFKLKKYMWMNSGEETMRTRSLLLGLMGVLDAEGWSLYGVLDQSIIAGAVTECDTWYVVRERGWQRGRPVWHR